MLQWIAEGHSPGSATNPQRVSARALAARRLVTIKGRGPAWTAELTDLGHYLLEHGTYPEPAPPPPGPVSDDTTAAGTGVSEAPPERPRQPEIDSPRGVRRRGYGPRGDVLFAPGEEDPYDEKILITVKEAAWMLSLSTAEIYRAVKAGEIDRVFIGSGRRNYLLVYGSMLAWVSDLPRESGAHDWWWRS